MKKALPIAVQSGNRHMEGRVYQNVTWVLQSMGQHQRSLEMSVEALIIAREVGDTATELLYLAFLVKILSVFGNF